MGSLQSPVPSALWLRGSLCVPLLSPHFSSTLSLSRPGNRTRAVRSCDRGPRRPHCRAPSEAALGRQQPRQAEQEHLCASELLGGAEGWWRDLGWAVRIHVSNDF